MLEKEQIKSLFDFCRLHGVEYFEVQEELVDHLAKAIDEKMRGNPTLNFDDALEEVYRGFGPAGFVWMDEESEEIAVRNARREYFQAVKKEFTWPQILEFLGITAAFFTLMTFNLKLGKMVGVYTIVLLFLYRIIISIKPYWKQYKMRCKLLKLKYNAVSLVVCLNLLNIYNLFRDSEWLNNNIIFYALFFGGWFTLILIEIRLSKRIRKMAMEDFADAALIAAA